MPAVAVRTNDCPGIWQMQVKRLFQRELIQGHAPGMPLDKTGFHLDKERVAVVNDLTAKDVFFPLTANAADS